MAPDRTPSTKVAPAHVVSRRKWLSDETVNTLRWTLAGEIMKCVAEIKRCQDAGVSARFYQRHLRAQEHAMEELKKAYPEAFDRLGVL